MDFFALKVTGGMTAAASTLGIFPFTSAQWKELETQAMIYNYMMASLPVPPDLLFPICRYLSDHPSSASSNSTLIRGYLKISKNKDPEPWRCKRTDGKKWRCSKDVAPDQKYCERHLHRGRPRSRKPVEQVHHSDFSSNKKGRFQSNVLLPPNPLVSNNRVTDNVGSSIRNLGSDSAHPYIVNPVFLDKSDKKAYSFDSMVSVSSYKEPRTMDWIMKGDAMHMASTSATDQQWQQHLMQTKTGLTTNHNSYCNNNTSIFNQNLNSYTNFVASEGQKSGCSIFLNPDMVPLEKPHTETPASFFDAWSNTEDKNGCVSANGKLSLSSLNLSMVNNNTINDEMGHLQMGLGQIESDDKPQITSWLTTLGGPLGEVLLPAAAGSASNPESVIGGNGDSGSTPATTVSSPSGVLQKTLASLSDSSNCSSPTLVASRVKPEIAFQWLK